MRATGTLATVGTKAVTSNMTTSEAHARLLLTSTRKMRRAVPSLGISCGPSNLRVTGSAYGNNGSESPPAPPTTVASNAPFHE